MTKTLEGFEQWCLNRGYAPKTMKGLTDAYKRIEKYSLDMVMVLSAPIDEFVDYYLSITHFKGSIPNRREIRHEFRTIREYYED